MGSSEKMNEGTTSSIANDVDAARAAAAAELEAAIAERPALAAVAAAAEGVYRDADRAFHGFQGQINAATRQGRDQILPATARLLDQQRRHRDAAAAAMTRTRAILANCDWCIETRRAEILQLDIITNPPAPDPGPRLRVVKRPEAPFASGEFEVIELGTAHG